MNYKLTFLVLVAGLFGHVKFSSAQKIPTQDTLGERIRIQRHYKLDPQKGLAIRVKRAMPETFKSFRAAGMNPIEHILTASEQKVVADAFAGLPRFYQIVLKDHLHSISFMDNMPNTALTSPLNRKDSFRLYNITFRAGILHENVTQWLTWKEGTCFDLAGSDISISVKGGNVGALTYVLMHEATHVVELTLGILPTDQPESKANPAFFGGNFIQGAWTGYRTTDPLLNDTLFLKNRFHLGGKVLQADMALKVYKSLQKSPFVSLYSTSSCSEDLAEYLSVYHLTQVQKQPFLILVCKKGKEIFRYEPMNSELVKSRAKIVREFYK